MHCWYTIPKEVFNAAYTYKVDLSRNGLSIATPDFKKKIEYTLKKLHLHLLEDLPFDIFLSLLIDHYQKTYIGQWDSIPNREHEEFKIINAIKITPVQSTKSEQDEPTSLLLNQVYNYGPVDLSHFLKFASTSEKINKNKLEESLKKDLKTQLEKIQKEPLVKNKDLHISNAASSDTPQKTETIVIHDVAESILNSHETIGYYNVKRYKNEIIACYRSVIEDIAKNNPIKSQSIYIKYSDGTYVNPNDPEDVKVEQYLASLEQEQIKTLIPTCNLLPVEPKQLSYRLNRPELIRTNFSIRVMESQEHDSLSILTNDYEKNKVDTLQNEIQSRLLEISTFGSRGSPVLVNNVTTFTQFIDSQISNNNLSNSQAIPILEDLFDFLNGKIPVSQFMEKGDRYASRNDFRKKIGYFIWFIGLTLMYFAAPITQPFIFIGVLGQLPTFVYRLMIDLVITSGRDLTQAVKLGMHIKNIAEELQDAQKSIDFTKKEPSNKLDLNLKQETPQKSVKKAPENHLEDKTDEEGEGEKTEPAP